VRVEVGYPDPEVRRIPRDDIRPRSMFGILAAQVRPRSADDLRQLARQAAELGLPGHAIASLRAASRLDATGKDGDDREVGRLRNEIAKKLVEHARDALEGGNRSAALLDAQLVEKTFTGTRAHDDAVALLDEIAKGRGPGRELDTIDTERTKKMLSSIDDRLQRARKRQLFSFSGAASIDAELRERTEEAVEVLERLWQPLQGRTPGAAVEPKLRQRYADVRTKVRDELIEQYLALGRIQVQLGALPEAAEHNEKACALDPESTACMRLRDLIVQARIQGSRW
jgi:hypothetical protein